MEPLVPYIDFYEFRKTIKKFFAFFLILVGLNDSVEAWHVTFVSALLVSCRLEMV